MKSEANFNDLLERENIKICAMPSYFISFYALMMRDKIPMTIVGLLDRMVI